MKIILFVLLAFTFFGCDNKKTSFSSELVSQGKTIYEANCIACHAREIYSEGETGPSIYGSSYELLKSKLTNGEYPLAYKPKRTSMNMGLFDLSDNEIKALSAYLNN